MEPGLFSKELDTLREKGLLRSLVATSPDATGRVEIDGKRFIDLSSNDYLGLSIHPVLKEAAKNAIERFGTGSRASRLMSGDVFLFRELEESVSALKGTESSLVFGSGYLCNLSILAAISGPSDCIFLDRFSHASLVDGALLSRARIRRFAHNDLENLFDMLEKERHRYRHAIIVAESIYSMDGDMAPVYKLVQMAKRFNAILIVDEAHALGVFGEHGEGVVERAEAEKPDIMVGTFGKALGGYGAFCACSKEIRDYLVNKARGLIYSTALPPSVLASNKAAVELLDTLGNERRKLLKMASDLRSFIKKELGLKTRGCSQIVPLILDDVNKCIMLEKHLFDYGFLSRAIRPPTVPKDSPRIRFSFSASHDSGVLASLKEALLSFFKR